MHSKHKFSTIHLLVFLWIMSRSSDALLKMCSAFQNPSQILKYKIIYYKTKFNEAIMGWKKITWNCTMLLTKN